MESYSYILSPTVSQELASIENTKKKTLLIEIPERVEIVLRFEKLISNISSNLLLSGRSLSENEITSALTRRDKGEKYSDVISIKNAFDYLRYSSHLTGTAVSKDIFLPLLKTLMRDNRPDPGKIETILNFINVSSEHAVVQTALCFALLLKVLPEDNNNIKIASIASQAYSYNRGYDFRGMVNLAEFFFSDLMTLKKKLKTARDSKNLTDFIEYFVQAYSIQAEKGYQMLAEKKISTKFPDNIKKLTERQKGILALFSIPDIKVSNKTVQKEFGISQITASRDLSKLHLLGMIFQKGKGRSIYYVKM